MYYRLLDRFEEQGKFFFLNSIKNFILYLFVTLWICFGLLYVGIHFCVYRNCSYEQLCRIKNYFLAFKSGNFIMINSPFFPINHFKFHSRIERFSARLITCTDVQIINFLLLIDIRQAFVSNYAYFCDEREIGILNFARLIFNANSPRWYNAIQTLATEAELRGRLPMEQMLPRCWRNNGWYSTKLDDSWKRHDVTISNEWGTPIKKLIRWLELGLSNMYVWFIDNNIILNALVLMFSNRKI